MSTLRKLAAVSAASALAFTLIGSVASGSPTPTYTDVGMWYSTWYAKTPVNTAAWITGYANAGANQFIGDVDGDGKDDAVMFKSDGEWKAGLSNGQSFDMPTTWRTGHGVGSDNQLLADVNGDGKADAVVFFSATGKWYAALSNGSGFNPYSLWISNHGAGSANQLLADVDGDGKCDAIAYDSANGDWEVALSSGSAFTGSGTWKTGFGVGSANQFASDADHDGKADIAVFYGGTGSWEVAESNGASFGAASTIISGHGIGSADQFFTDGNGDGYADAYVCFNGDVNGDGKNGDCYVRVYQSPELYMITGVYQGSLVFHSGFGANASKRFVGNVSGNANGWKDTIAFFQSTGVWKAEPYRYFKKNIYDTWDAWNIDYVPYVKGAYQQYDSGDPDVIDEHIAQISAAGVDFLLFDETNNVHVDDNYIWQRAITVAERIKAWNDDPSHRPLKFAIAVGGIQFSLDPRKLEYEAGEVYDTFVNSDLGDNYYEWDGKPLLVVYHGNGGLEAWEDWTGDKSDAGEFTLRWANGQAQAGYYGWAVSGGTIADSEVQVVMPGWNNRKGAPVVLRNGGQFYEDDCWDVVLANRPEIVMINSYNEYAEQTAVAKTDTSGLDANSEKWYNDQAVLDPDMYWDMTVQFIQQLNP